MVRPINVTVTSPQPTSPPAAQALAPPDGLSPLSARILDQLSLTAWLPAALVVANAYLVVGMYLVREPDSEPSIENLKEVVAALNDKPIGVILAVIFGVVLIALVTQSFEFAAIRFLEGYWGGSALAAVPTWLGTQVQRFRIALLDRRADKLERSAFRAVVERVARDLRTQPDLASAVLLVGTGGATGHLGNGLKAQAEQYYHEKRWMKWAPAHLRHRANSLSNRRAAYPQRPSRLMPTRLGNALRSAEDQLIGDVAGPKMRGYLYEHLDSFGPTLMQQHNQYRNRLDMYAVLTVIAALLAALDVWLLPTVLPGGLVVAVTVGLVTLSYFSYRGAISAALDYGPILLAMNRAIQRTQGANSTSGQRAPSAYRSAGGVASP